MILKIYFVASMFLLCSEAPLWATVLLSLNFFFAANLVVKRSKKLQNG